MNDVMNSLIGTVFLVCWVVFFAIGLWAAWSFLPAWAALMITSAVVGIHLSAVAAIFE